MIEYSNLISEAEIAESNNVLFKHSSIVKGYWNTLNLEHMFDDVSEDLKSEYKEWILQYHDMDKLSEDGNTHSAFALRYAIKYHGKEVDPKVKADIARIVMAHRFSQPHHIEFYTNSALAVGNFGKFEKVYKLVLGEIVADWYTVAEARGANVVKWYKAQCANRVYYVDDHCGAIILKFCECLEPFLVENRLLQRFGSNPTEENPSYDYKFKL